MKSQQMNKPKWLLKKPYREDYFVATGEVEWGGGYMDTGHFNDQEYNQHMAEYFDRHYWHPFDQLREQDILKHFSLNRSIKVTMFSHHAIRSYNANQFKSYDELWIALEKDRSKIRLIKYHNS